MKTSNLHELTSIHQLAVLGERWKLP